MVLSSSIVFLYTPVPSSSPISAVPSMSTCWIDFAALSPKRSDISVVSSVSLMKKDMAVAAAVIAPTIKPMGLLIIAFPSP